MRITSHHSKYKLLPAAVAALVLLYALLSCVTSVPAQSLDLGNPTAFFTNVASRLLRFQLGVDLNHIQLYPTNEYTPAVHRLLQVTANVYDAATNRAAGEYPYLPTVFRPRFTNETGAIYINGYTEESGLGVLSAPMRDLGSSSDRSALQSADMVCGIPIIVGARKGFPNFNELALLNDIRVVRSLTFHRPVANGPVTQTNQIYDVGISNAIGVEAWNSYSNPFARELQMIVAADIICSVTTGTDTSAYALGPDGNPLIGTNHFVSMLVTNNWPGFTTIPSAASFIVPLSTNYLFLTNCDYSFTGNQFVSPGNPLNDLPNVFPIPQWRINLTTRLRFTLIDTSAQRIVDYVNLAYTQPPVEVTAQLASGATCDGSWSGSIADLFCTNRVLGTANPQTFTYGLNHQYNISLGLTSVDDNFWRQYNAQANDKDLSIFAFRRRMLGVDTAQQDFAAPFSPVRTIHQNISWQANDPLVHFMVQDLFDLLGGAKTITFDTDTTSDPFSGLGGRMPLNKHYRPWGGNPASSADTIPPTKFSTGLKDPLVSRSDAWSFPTNGYPKLDWLGPVHRSTPWQTLFLKSTNVDPLAWQKWTGVTNAAQAAATQPTNDWQIVSLILSQLNTNDPHFQHPLNPAAPAAWQVALDGLTAETNGGALIVISSNSPQASLIAGALDSARQTRPFGHFQDISDILSVAELTVASPFLNLGTGVNSITDEAYEKIPSQLLPLLRPESIGSIAQTPAGIGIQFSGVDGYPYAIEVSSNLIDWARLATNVPTNGSFGIVEPRPLPSPPARFYRSSLLP